MIRSSHRVVLASALALASACAASVSEVGKTVVTPPPQASVTVSPPSATLYPTTTQQFSATVSGSISSAVTWTVEGTGSGTVNASGLYTAPGSTGTFRVVATSVDAPAVSGRATVAVVPTSGVDTGDVPPWIAAMPQLANGMKWMPGVPGGIPAGTLDTTLTPAQMTASGINAALSAASGRGSPTNIRVVQMPAGTFSISGTINARNFTILRGAGAWGTGRTRLNFSSGGGVDSSEPTWPSAVTVSLPTGGSLPVGSSEVTVSSASGFQVGDLMQLDQLDDLSYVCILDAGYNKRAPFTDGPYHGPRSPGGFRSVASVHQITAISGNTVTFDPPTRIAYDEAMNPEAWRVARMGSTGLWWFGFEQASITGPGGGAVVYRPGAFNWVKDVETDGTGGISDDHIRFEHQFRSEIRRVYSHDNPLQSGGANYGINLNAATSECLVIDSIVKHMNKLIQTNACGPGNVIAYNYTDDTSANGGDWMDGAINGSHQSFSHHLLVEGNWSANIGCDTTHGNSGYMAFLRNYAHGRSTGISNGNNLRAANSDGWQREMAFMGNVLMTAASGTYQQTGAVGGYSIWSIGQNVWGAGDEYDGQTTLPPRNSMNYGGTVYDNRQATFTTKAMDKLFRHGNWDSVHASIFDWQADFPAHAVADSLFLPAAPDFFGAGAWPWIDPGGATAGDRVKTLPAKARYDAGTPFAVP